jgi:hypothetical protein
MHLSNIAKTSFVGVAIGLLVITIVQFLFEETKIGYYRQINYDAKMISALQNISKLVPEGEVLTTANNRPVVIYFTGREVFEPWHETSYSLLNRMKEKNYTYLLVFENQSGIPEFAKMFTKDELPKLSMDFREIATYITSFSKLHLYKRIT